VAAGATIEIEAWPESLGDTIDFLKGFEPAIERGEFRADYAWQRASRAPPRRSALGIAASRNCN